MASPKPAQDFIRLSAVELNDFYEHDQKQGWGECALPISGDATKLRNQK